jgi:hypothetical protein
MDAKHFLALREEHRLSVFENGELRKIFGPKKDEVTGQWRRLHNKELCDLYPSPDIILVITSRRIKWAEQVARTGHVHTGIWYGNLMEYYFEDLGVDGRIILKYIFKK